MSLTNYYLVLAAANGDTLVGQLTMAASLPVTLASDQTAITVTANYSGATGAAVPANAAQVGGPDSGGLLRSGRIYDADTGAGTEYVLGSNIRISGAGGSIEAKGQQLMASSIPVVISSDQSAITVTATNASIGLNGAAIPTSSTQVGGTDGTNLQPIRLFDADTGGGTQFVLGTVLRQSASGGSVEVGTTTTPLQTLSTSSTGTQTSVASSATNVTLLAANLARRGATIYNDSTKTLYVKMGATASATSYAVQLGSGGYWEVPFGYTGIIDGIWSTANGNARITELT
jgi:hypothetical protein